MKKLLLGFVALLTVATAVAQNSFSYQAVIRDDGKVLENKTVSLRLSVMLADSVYYKEVHQTTTNAYGNVNVNVGEGTGLQGSFTAIPWETMRVMMQVEVSTDGSTYTNMGALQIQPVPYTMYAPRTTTVIQPKEATDEPIFQIKDNDGNMLFAVYETGVKVFVDYDDDSKAAKAKFAVSSIRRNKGEEDLLTVDNQGATIYVEDDDNQNDKAAKAKFAVSSIRRNKGDENLLTIDNQGATIYVDDDSQNGKAAKAKFAVSSIRRNKGDENLMTVDGQGATIYVDDNQSGKAAKAKFAVSSIRRNKGEENLMTVDGQGATIYVDDNQSGKAAKAKFAVSSIRRNKSEENLFTIDGDGSTVYVDFNTTDKAAKAKFAVAGRSGKGDDDVLNVDGDQATFYIDLDENESDKAAKSTFAVASARRGKTEPEPYFIIDRFGSLVYIDDDSENGKAAKAKFAVAGRSGKGDNYLDKYLTIEEDSTRLYINDKTSGSSNFAIVDAIQNEDLLYINRDSTLININTYVSGEFQTASGEVLEMYPDTTTNNQGIDADDLVDLGLSVKWATHNIGASEGQIGNYYSWGETGRKDSYGYYDYVTYPYNIKESNFKDAATINLGDNYRVPTKKEWEELFDECDWTINGNLATVTSRINNNSITLPVTGYYADDELYSSAFAYYWCRNLADASNGYGWVAYFASDDGFYKELLDDEIYVYYGLPIRPVANSYHVTVKIAVDGEIVDAVNDRVTGISSGVYKAGTILHARVSPAAGERFNGWSDSNESNRDIVVDNDMELVAYFTTSNSTLPQGAINGEFSVADGVKVYFSKGNLQYNASTDKWQFAENQYDYIGGESSPNSETAYGNNLVSEDYDGWIDLFGWGTSGYDEKYPYMTSDENDDYGNDNDDIIKTNYDWGRYNAIENGGKQIGLWRTLSNNQWEYLLDREDGDLCGLAQVEDINGLVLLPDEWENPDDIDDFVSGNGDGFETNIYSAEEWEQMEAAGAVFLPAAGYRYRYWYDGTIKVEYGTTYGYYWSSSACWSSSAYHLVFYGSGGFYTNNNSRYQGYSVRLVTNKDRGIGQKPKIEMLQDAISIHPHSGSFGFEIKDYADDINDLKITVYRQYDGGWEEQATDDGDGNVYYYMTLNERTVTITAQDLEEGSYKVEITEGGKPVCESIPLEVTLMDPVVLNLAEYTTADELGDDVTEAFKSFGVEKIRLKFEGTNNVADINLYEVVKNCINACVSDYTFGYNTEAELDFSGCSGPWVSEVAEAAFATNYCKNWTITLSNSTTKIGASAFSGCGDITVLNTDNITEIGESAFYNNLYYGIDSLSLPNIEKIGSQAFGKARILILDLGTNSDIDIANDVFYSVTTNYDQNRTTINTLNIGNYTGSVKNLFTNSNGAKVSYFATAETNTKYLAVSDGLILVEKGVDGAPNTIHMIENNYSSTQLTYIKMEGSGVVEITENQFIGNYNYSNTGSYLYSVFLDGVKTIGKKAFYGCKNLSYIDLGDEVECIREYAFDGSGEGGTSDHKVILPANLKYVGSDALYLNTSRGPWTFDTQNFDSNNWYKVIIPDGSVEINGTTYSDKDVLGLALYRGDILWSDAVEKGCVESTDDVVSLIREGWCVIKKVD